MSAHTPGPWSVRNESPCTVRIPDAQGVLLVHAATKADARLISAAPDLLAALRKVEAHHVEQNRLKGRDESRSTTLSIVRAAIAKAEGAS